MGLYDKRNVKEKEIAGAREKTRGYALQNLKVRKPLKLSCYGAQSKILASERQIMLL